MSIKSRVTKARQQVENVVPNGAYKMKRRYGMRSLSNSANFYSVVLEFTGKNNIEDITLLVLNTTCQSQKRDNWKHSENGLCNCKGNEKTVCYHSMAAIIKAAELKNQTVVFFDNFSQALNYSKLGGKLVKVQSTQGNKKHGWIVVKEKTNFKERVNMMRGEVENGID